VGGKEVETVLSKRVGTGLLGLPDDKRRGEAIQRLREGRKHEGPSIFESTDNEDASGVKEMKKTDSVKKRQRTEGAKNPTEKKK